MHANPAGALSVYFHLKAIPADVREHGHRNRQRPASTGDCVGETYREGNAALFQEAADAGFVSPRPPCERIDRSASSAELKVCVARFGSGFPAHSHFLLTHVAGRAWGTDCRAFEPVLWAKSLLKTSSRTMFASTKPFFTAMRRERVTDTDS